MPNEKRTTIHKGWKRPPNRVIVDDGAQVWKTLDFTWKNEKDDQGPKTADTGKEKSQSHLLKLGHMIHNTAREEEKWKCSLRCEKVPQTGNGEESEKSNGFIIWFLGMPGVKKEEGEHIHKHGLSQAHWASMWKHMRWDCVGNDTTELRGTAKRPAPLFCSPEGLSSVYASGWDTTLRVSCVSLWSFAPSENAAPENGAGLEMLPAKRPEETEGLRPLLNNFAKK